MNDKTAPKEDYLPFYVDYGKIGDGKTDAFFIQCKEEVPPWDEKSFERLSEFLEREIDGTIYIDTSLDNKLPEKVITLIKTTNKQRRETA